MAKPDKILAHELLDREVLDLRAGEVVGSVVDFGINREGKVQLIGILPTAWYGGGRGITPASITFLTEDRLCIANGEALEGFTPDGDTLISTNSGGEIYGKTVLLHDGEMLGELADFRFNLGDGKITDLLVLDDEQRRTRIPIDKITTIGKDYIIIERGAATVDSDAAGEASPFSNAAAVQAAPAAADSAMPVHYPETPASAAAEAAAAPEPEPAVAAAAEPEYTAPSKGRGRGKANTGVLSRQRVEPEPEPEPAAEPELEAAVAAPAAQAPEAVAEAEPSNGSTAAPIAPVATPVMTFEAAAAAAMFQGASAEPAAAATAVEERAPIFAEDAPPAAVWEEPAATPEPIPAPDHGPVFDTPAPAAPQPLSLDHVFDVPAAPAGPEPEVDLFEITGLQISKFDQKKLDFLRGKLAHRDIKDSDGIIVVAKDEVLDQPALMRIVKGGVLGEVFIEMTLKK